MQQDTKWPYSGGLAIVTMETKPLWRTVRSRSWRKHLQEKKRFAASLMDDLSGLVSVCNRLQPKQWPVCCTLWTTSVLSNYSVCINIHWKVYELYTLLSKARTYPVLFVIFPQIFQQVFFFWSKSARSMTGKFLKDAHREFPLVCMVSYLRNLCIVYSLEQYQSQNPVTWLGQF